MTKNTRGPADAANNGEHIHPTNTSRSYNRGGGVIREALRGTEGRNFHVGGGMQDHGGEPSLEDLRRSEERAKDVSYVGSVRHTVPRKGY